jgi:hypothetical protein
VAAIGFRGATLALAALAGCSSHTSVPAGKTGIAWAAPTTNADGSPLGDLAGFKLHLGPTSRGGNASYVYPQILDIGVARCTGGDCQWDLDLPAGTTYVSVTAYDTATPPNESAYSNELQVTR